ncbi:MAG: S8 family serine peptidase [Candidatus Eisenbacteria bacterium]
MQRRLAVLVFFVIVVVGFGLFAAPPSPGADEVLIPLHLAAGYGFDPTVSAPAADSRIRPLEEGEEGYFLVQFSFPVGERERERLRASGAEPVAYQPDFAWIVRATEAALTAARAVDGVRWAGRWDPAFKKSPLIGTAEFFSPGRREDHLLTLRVRVFDDLGGTASQAEEIGFDVLESTDDGFQKLLVVHGPAEGVDELARIERVWWIEELPEYRLHNSTTKWVVQSNVSGQTPVWDRGLHGEDEIIFLMDSGLDYNSCWFRDAGSAPPGPSHRKVISYQAYGGGVLYDGCDPGHGTHVAGTVAGDQSFINPGNYGYNGMAYAAKLGMQDIQDNDTWTCTTGGVSPPTSLTGAYTDAYNGGARVHSNSWGGSTNAYDAYCVNVDAFMNSHRDFLILFAAGNAGSGGSTVGYPGTAKNCITVGATRQAPNQETIAGYSSRGPAFDSRYKPTVSAPGGEAGYGYICSADNSPNNPPSNTCAVQCDPFQGTSMATPAVAGLAGLTRQYFREGWYPGGAAGSGPSITPSAALVKAVLVNAGTDIASADIPNNNEGWGRVLLDDALHFAGDSRELRVEDEDVALGTGQSAEFPYEVEAGEPLEVVLVWTDPAAAQSASIALVNDLDLTVSGPSGTFKGNVFSGGNSVGGGSYDRRNVEEVVRLSNPSPGTYTVRVDGYNVPTGPQKFALAATGAFMDEGGVNGDLSTVAVNDHLMMGPNGGDSTMTIVVTAKDGNGDPMPGIPAGDVEVHLAGVSSLGAGFMFCTSGSDQATFLSGDPTDAYGRCAITVSNVGGCGTVTVSATIDGVPLTNPATANVKSPDFNGDGKVDFFDTFKYLPMLNSGTGYCGNLNNSADGVVNFFDTAKYLPYLATGSQCPMP